LRKLHDVLGISARRYEPPHRQHPFGVWVTIRWDALRNYRSDRHVGHERYASSQRARMADNHDSSHHRLREMVKGHVNKHVTRRYWSVQRRVEFDVFVVEDLVFVGLN
jgi:hypothetical protein